MAKRFDTEPATPGDENEIESLLVKQIEKKISLLESRILELESKLKAKFPDSPIMNMPDQTNTDWLNNEKSLGRIAGIIPSPFISLRERLDDDVN